MLNLAVFLALGILLLFSTLLIVPLPFIVFSTGYIPDNLTVLLSNDIITAGVYQTNLQLPAIILSAYILNPRLSFIFVSFYLLAGFSGYPVFFFGGGESYWQEASIGYILAILPLTLLISNLAWYNQNRDKYLFNSRYLSAIGFLGLATFHIIGMTYSYIMTFQQTNLAEIMQVYFLIPLTGNLLLIICLSIIAADFNRMKFFLLKKYRSITRKLFNYIIKPKSLM